MAAAAAVARWHLECIVTLQSGQVQRQMHSNGTLPLDTPLDARCVYSFRGQDVGSLQRMEEAF